MATTVFLANANQTHLVPGYEIENSDVSDVLDAYLGIKNSLVKDDAKKAAEFGTALANATKSFDSKSSSSSEVNEILEVIKEHGEHIAKSDIGHQREHFAELTNEVKDLVKITGSDRTLYTQYCPMYNSNKGGFWLSTSKEIRNPLFGSKMLKCGSVKETIEKK